jgi:RNA recognition motif-containing protein
LPHAQIDPKNAIPREEHLRVTRYFVGALAPHSSGFFSKFGQVVDATVMVDRETGRSKGFGFVTFEDNSNDSQLVGKLGLILDDKQVHFHVHRLRVDSSRALWIELHNHAANAISNDMPQPHRTALSTTAKSSRQGIPRRWSAVCHSCP